MPTHTFFFCFAGKATHTYQDGSGFLVLLGDNLESRAAGRGHASGGHREGGDGLLEAEAAGLGRADRETLEGVDESHRCVVV